MLYSPDLEEISRLEPPDWFEAAPWETGVDQPDVVDTMVSLGVGAEGVFRLFMVADPTWRGPGLVSRRQLSESLEERTNSVLELVDAEAGVVVARRVLSEFGERILPGGMMTVVGRSQSGTPTVGVRSISLSQGVER